MNKKTDKNKKEATKFNKPSTCGGNCGVVSPAPKYDLKTAVGLIGHCQDKIREPGYTIPKARLRDSPCFGPGPNYFYKLPGISGYTFPRAVYRAKPPCTPGPKYMLPGFWSPAYTIVGKPKHKCSEAIAGPYPAPKQLCKGPAYSFGLRGRAGGCDINPGIRNVGPITLIRPRAPTFCIIPKRPISEKCKSPGPKYTLPTANAPEYSFGIKHHICKVIPKTDCDELC